MSNEFLSRHVGTMAVGSGALGASVYLLMIGVTLPHLEAVSGHVPFDMRPFGYGPAEAADFLDALGPDGRTYYLTHQIPLDTVYPALLALTLIATICWFGRRISDRRVIRLGIALSVGCAAFDYFENLGIMAMLWKWPDVPGPLVLATGAATIGKSAFTTLAVLLTLAIALNWARLRRI